MKKIIKKGAMLLALATLTLSVAACGGNATETDNNTDASGSGKAAIKIGISQIAEHAALDASRDGFLDRLEEHGYKEGENLTVVYQNAQGEQANAQTIAQTFASDSSLDLILAIATPTAQSIVNLIDSVPVLVTAVTDPEDAGLVASNENPGSNVSGTSDLNPIKEQLDLLQQLVPDVETVGIMYAAGEANSIFQAGLVEARLEELGLKAEHYTVSHSNDLQSVIESSIGKVDAWYLPTDNMFADAMGTVSQVAKPAKMPVIAGEENMVNQGALATVSLDYYGLGEMTADMAIEILEEGKDPGTMPIRYQEDPTIFINEEFAEAIGVEIPAELLEQAGGE